MKTIFTSPSLIEVQEAKTILEMARIDCKITNDQISFLAGEIPYATTWPQLDLCFEEDAIKAEQLLHDWKNKPAVVEENWQCQCGENHEGQFALCWSCGAQKKQ